MATGDADPQERRIAAARRVAREARALRKALEEISRNATAKRRLTVLTLAFGIVVGAQLVDAHSEMCGPYARTERRALSPTWVAVCDVMAPLHSHSAAGWATRANVVGLVLYGSVAGTGIRWYKRALRAPDDMEPE